MGQALHGSATTTEAIRRAIQHSQESLGMLAKRYGINPETAAIGEGRHGDKPAKALDITTDVLLSTERTARERTKSSNGGGHFRSGTPATGEANASLCQG